MKLTFKGITEEKIQNCFTEVFSTYTKLHAYDVILEQTNIKNTTMQAQPLIGIINLFTGKKRYKIKLANYIKDSKIAKVVDLPSDVLKGWFAHELGHLVDYKGYSNWQMMAYGFRYLSSVQFKMKVEHEADMLAIEHGFGEEIIASKQFILNSSLFDAAYKSNIKKYYMPLEMVEKRIGRH